MTTNPYLNTFSNLSPQLNDFTTTSIPFDPQSIQNAQTQDRLVAAQAAAGIVLPQYTKQLSLAGYIDPIAIRSALNRANAGLTMPTILTTDPENVFSAKTAPPLATVNYPSPQIPRIDRF
jgi:hypothetical protein